MTIQGLPPVGRLDRPGEQSIQLKENQRISADVLKVSGDQVTLVIQGVRVVGKLVPGEQSNALRERTTAQFIVRGMDNGVLQLQLLRGEVSTTTAPQGNPWTALAQNLLRLIGLPVNEKNTVIARALLSKGMPVSQDLMQEMSKVLDGLKNWGQTEADLAATLKAGGCPLSSGSLALALETAPSLADGVLRLQERLSQLTKGANNSEIANLAQKALLTLTNSTVDWNAPLPELMEQLPLVVSLWGKSIESAIAEQMDSQNNIKGDMSGWLALANLRSALQNEGNQSLVKEIDNFLNALRQMQFLNSAQIEYPTNPPWLSISIPLDPGIMKNNVQSDRQLFPANLRIAYRSEEDGQSIDPNNTRLILSIDLEDGDFLQADISIIGKRLGAWLTVSNPDLRSQVEQELPSLKEGLSNQGFLMQFARCVVGKQTTIASIPEMPYQDANMKINLSA